MATRTSIELHPDGCRVVEVDLLSDAARGTVVRAFAASLADGRDATTVTEALARLRRTRNLQRRAWVTIWGLRSTPLTPAQSAIDDVRDHIQPIVSAGFVVEGAGTPAHALAALARSRTLPPGATTAYVAITARATSVALVRDGVLLFGRELPWGHAGATAIDQDRGDGLKQSLTEAAHASGAAMDSVVLCGDMANLGAFAERLSVSLAVPVETFAWAAGLDLTASPELARSPRSEVAAARLAIAAGADPAPAESLLPHHICVPRPRPKRVELGVAAAVVAGLLFAAVWYCVVYRTADVVPAERRAGPEHAAPMLDRPTHLQTDPR